MRALRSTPHEGAHRRGRQREEAASSRSGFGLEHVLSKALGGEPLDRGIHGSDRDVPVGRVHDLPTTFIPYACRRATAKIAEIRMSRSRATLLP